MTEARLRELLHGFLPAGTFPLEELPAALYPNLLTYLELLLRWNARTNLTAVREPEEIVTRHFGEGLFAAACLRPYLAPDATLLDLGSGAGFPGLPIQLALPGVRVTLAESQGKKANFLREAVRVLGLRTEVWAGRVEAMPASRNFAVVTLRAVDSMTEARAAGAERLTRLGLLAELGSDSEPGAGGEARSEAGEEGKGERGAAKPATLVSFRPPIPIPASVRRVLRLWVKEPAAEFHVEQAGS